MKKDNIKENEIDNKEDGVVDTSKQEISNVTEENQIEETTDVTEEEYSNENDTSEELQELINGESKEDENKEEPKSSSFIKNIFANIFDQLILIASSGIILLAFDFIIRKIGYMVVIPSAVLLIIYAIVNCIYAPIMEKTKAKKTFAKKILNIK